MYVQIVLICYFWFASNLKLTALILHQVTVQIQLYRFHIQSDPSNEIMSYIMTEIKEKKEKKKKEKKRIQPIVLNSQFNEQFSWLVQVTIL